ncbi:MAG TPA: hypothetical protein VLK56_01995 [Solirubrobacterales bacterium]|nr:hypothetical protein [Solirubrobacterales bacterium]
MGAAARDLAHTESALGRDAFTLQEKEEKMNRNLRVLGLVLMTALAAGALFAPDALATEEPQPAYFVSGVGGGETAKIDGSSIEATTFSIGILSVTCATASFTGQAITSGEQSTEVKLEPKYETCHSVIAGITKLATITTNGCTYVLNATVTYPEEGRKTEYPTKLKLECPEGKQIEVHVYEAKESEEKTLCTYDAKAQELGSGVTLTNNEGASPPHITADLSVSNIALTNTKTSIVCGTKESTTATYSGPITLLATNGKSEYVSLQGKQPKRFRFGIGPAVATGEKGTAEIATEKGPITCTNVHYVGTSSMFAKDLTITPKYEGCTFLTLTTDIKFEGCTYTFKMLAGTFNNGTGVGETHTTGPMEILCPGANVIKAEVTEAGGKAVKCTITVFPQSPEGLVDYKNTTGKTAPEDNELFTNTVTGLFYEVEGGGGACGETAQTFINGKLEGKITVNGYEDKGGTPPATGAQVSLQVKGDLAP